MSKPVKELITNELQSRYAEMDSALWVELIKTGGIETNDLRRDLVAKNMRLEVIKNALFRRAVADGPLSKLAEQLVGPAALVTGGDSLVDVAKTIEGWLPKLKGLKLRGAVLEGEYFDESRVEGLAKMPSKADLQARIIGMALSPGANIAGVLVSSGGVAGCIKALIEKLEDGEEVVAKSA
ncbi:MAG: 50S ribosomal protein L10 [Phycisphaerae bacterium]|nr:50S ribosomal protein L10 [Phycisphaerae bacterium]